MGIDRDYILRLAAEDYKKDLSVFNNQMLKKDVYTFFVVRKMVKRFLVAGVINDKLILNNIIVCLNVFGIKKTNTIFRIICDDQEFSVIKSCLIYLNSFTLTNDTLKPNHVMRDILKDITHRYHINPKGDSTITRRIITMKNIIIQYILKRLTEASTLKGIILSVSGACGIVLSQDQTNSAVWIVLGIVGIIGSLLPDNFNKSIKENVPDTTEMTTESKSEYPSIVPLPLYKKEQPTTESGWGDKS